MSDLDEPDSIVPPALREPTRGPPRAWVAVVLSLIFAGAGHIVRGRWRRGLGWNLGAFACWPLLLHWTLPTVALILVWRVAVAVDAVRSRPIEPRPSGGIALLLILALFAADVAVALSVRQTLVQSFSIPSGSMIPTLQIGDKLLVSKRAHTLERGEVITFHYPKNPRQDFVKRIIGIPGDSVELRADGAVILNGRPLLQESLGDCHYDDLVEQDDGWHSRDCTLRSESVDGHEYRVIFAKDREHDQRGFAPVTVPPDSYYVLGDNRDNSHDSRFWGTVPRALVIGTAMRVWWSDGPNGVRMERLQLPVQ